jgi:precorrin-3B methylase
MLSVIGIGPGSQAMMTMEAVEALQAAEMWWATRPTPTW